MIDAWGIPCEIALRSLLLDLADDDGHRESHRPANHSWQNTSVR